jgi:two-component system sensor histidine kinase KdpD
MGRGRLRIYLGAAPGVGKTFAMLDEGFRRRQRGTDVVVGYVETHGRANTAAKLRDLEVIARRAIDYRGQTFAEMDVDAVLERRPAVALVDELAHTNIPGSRNTKRWQDIAELLDAGIDVISTVNIQHLESLNDVVEEITGITQRETVPDAFVRRAERIELVDMTPEALRRRMAHGNIYAADKVDAALRSYFRPGNLTALRELALLWVADQVDAALHDYRQRHGIVDAWETRERVAVALTGAPGSDDLIRRAARIAARSKAELIGIHVESPDGLTARRGDLEAHRRLLGDLDGTYREVVDADIGRALVRTAIAEDATQLVIGASRRSRWTELVQGSVVNKIAQRAGCSLDIHILAVRPDDTTDPTTPARRRSARWSRLPRRRQQAGVLSAISGLPLITVALTALRDTLGFASVGFVYLLAVVLIATIGGAWVAALAAGFGFLLLNYYFADPIHTFTIGNERDAVALVVFLVVAAIVSFLTERFARRSADATRARSEAETLASMTGVMLRDDDPLQPLVAVLVSSFDLRGAAILRAENHTWITEAASGPKPPASPDDATLARSLAHDIQLAVAGELTADDRRVLDSFAAQLELALNSRQLRQDAAHAAGLAKASELRATLLNAISHDLRTPLTTIKTTASSLQDPAVAVDPDVHDELLDVIVDEADRLNEMVANLVDLGRIEADVVTVRSLPVDVHDVVAAAIRATANGTSPLQIELPGELPAVAGDAVLLERVVANLLANAFRYSPPGSAVVLRAYVSDGRVELHVIDDGPGIPAASRQRVFEPFQRLDGAPEDEGVGLGLAVARGFIEAMNGTLEVENTPGGGTTMIATLATINRAESRDAQAPSG